MEDKKIEKLEESKPRYECELWVEEYFGLSPLIEETDTIDTDYGHLVNLCAMVKEKVLKQLEDKKAPVQQKPEEVLSKIVGQNIYTIGGYTTLVTITSLEALKAMQEFGSQERNRAIQEAIDLHTAMRWGTWHEIHDQLIKLSKLKK